MRVISIVNHGDRPAPAAHMQYVVELLRMAQGQQLDVVVALPPQHTIQTQELPDYHICAYCSSIKPGGACPCCGASVDYEFLIEVPTKVLAEWHEEP